MSVNIRLGKCENYIGAVVFGDSRSSSTEVIRVIPPMPNAEVLHRELACIHDTKLTQRLSFSTMTADEIIDALEAFCDFGQPLSPLSNIFSSEQITLTGCTEFQKKCYEQTSLIPHGETRSYAWLATRLGKSEAPRAVGNALRKNSFPLIIPCHRVVKKDGALGGYMGTDSFESWQLVLKKSLLELECAHQQPSLFTFFAHAV